MHSNGAKIITLDSVVTQILFSSHGDFLTYVMHHYRKRLIKLTQFDETKKRAHDSQIVRAKENINWSYGRPSLSYRWG